MLLHIASLCGFEAIWLSFEIIIVTVLPSRVVPKSSFYQSGQVYFVIKILFAEAQDS